MQGSLVHITAMIYLCQQNTCSAISLWTDDLTALYSRYLRVKETVVSVLFSNTRTCLLYNE